MEKRKSSSLILKVMNNIFGRNLSSSLSQKMNKKSKHSSSMMLMIKGNKYLRQISIMTLKSRSNLKKKHNSLKESSSFKKMKRAKQLCLLLLKRQSPAQQERKGLRLPLQK